MKFVLFVEGHTERRAISPFLKRWLDAKLPNRVGITVSRFEGCREFITDVEQRTRITLNAPSGRDVLGIIGLLDWYGMPLEVPSRIETRQERVDWATQEIENRVSDARFKMFFAVHEFEAWLFSDATVFPSSVRERLVRDGRLPEAVNDGEPPARLLERLYPQCVNRDYKKRVDGVQMFGKLDPKMVYDKCPNFRRLADTMLEMAQSHDE